MTDNSNNDDDNNNKIRYTRTFGRLGSRSRWIYSFTEVRFDVRSEEVVKDNSAYDNANYSTKIGSSNECNCIPYYTDNGQDYGDSPSPSFAFQ